MTDELTPRAVIFDMDGLLLDSEPLYRVTWQTAAAELGCPIDDDFYARFVGRGNDEAEQLLHERFGDALPLDEFRVRWRRDFDERLARAPLARKPGAIELLDRLDKASRRRWPPPRHAQSPFAASANWRRDSLPSHSAMRSSTRSRRLISFCSPRSASASSPADCLVLEDSEAGVRAARAAGMDVILVPDLVEPSPEIAAMATRVCRSLHEVRQMKTPRQWRSEGGALRLNG